jgi:hypothetical protein
MRFFINGTEVEEPIGWDAITFRAQRMDSSGIDQIFSTDIQFYGLGAQILKSIYDEFFITVPAYFRIISEQYINGEPWQFYGQINFALYEEQNVCDTDSWIVSVGIIQDLFREKFKARLGTDIDLFNTRDLDGVEIDPLNLTTGLTRIRLHSQNFYLAGSARQLAETSSYLGETANAGGRKFLVPPYYWGNSDYKDNYGSSVNPTGLNYTNTNVNFQNNTGYTRNFNIQGNIGFYIENLSAYFPFGIDHTFKVILDFIVRDASHNIAAVVFLYETPTVYEIANPAGSTEFTASYAFDFAFYLDAGFSFQFRLYAQNPYNDDEVDGIMLLNNLEGTFFNLNEINLGEQYASPCDGFLIKDYFKRIVYLMTGDADGILSDTFEKDIDGCYWNNFVTIGLQIRNGASPNQGINPQMVTNFKDAFDALYTIFCLGWAYEQSESGAWKIRIEKLDFFYKNNITLDPTNIGVITRKAMSDKLLNQVTIGFTDRWKNISISGIYAIHTERNYSINNKATRDGTTAKLELLSTYICEGNTIEFLRRLQFLNNESNPGSSDRPNDYDFFVIWLNREDLSFENVVESGYGYQNETGLKYFYKGTVSYNSDFIAFSSAVAQRLYNIYHTPVRIACRHWKLLGMHTYGMIDPVMMFQSGEYFTSYESRITGTDENIDCIEVLTDVNLSEQADISVAILNDWAKPYLFKPIEIEFEYPQSFCDYITLSFAHQYNKVRANSGNFSQSGYITSVENKPNDQNGGTTTFKLIASNIPDPEPPPQGGAYSEAYSSAYS